ncbi:hypothetical protein D3C72_182230 [compost metagenome]
MVACAENAGKQRQAYNNIEPFLDHFAVDTVELDHQEGQNRSHDQLPNAFHPQVDDIPPVHLVEREVGRIVEGKQEEDRDAPETEDQDIGDDGLAALQRCHGDIEEEHQADDDDADLDGKGLFKEFASLMDLEHVAHDGNGRGDEKDPELRDCQLWAIKFGFRLFGKQIVGCPHETDQQPDDQRIGMDHPDDVERQKFGKSVWHDIDRAGQNAEQHLRQEEADRAVEIQHRDLLSLVFHRMFLLGSELINRRRSAAISGC